MSKRPILTSHEFVLLLHVLYITNVTSIRRLLVNVSIQCLTLMAAHAMTPCPVRTNVLQQSPKVLSSIHMA